MEYADALIFVAVQFRVLTLDTRLRPIKEQVSAILVLLFVRS